MVPNFIIIALVITLIAITKEYWTKTRVYDYAMNSTCLLGWLCTILPSITIYAIALTISILLFISSYFLWGRGKKEINVPTATNVGEDMSVTPFMKGYVGKVVAEMPNGSYLGTTLKDGSPTEVIVYSEEPMEPGDQFEIIGIVGAKIMAFKK